MKIDQRKITAINSWKIKIPERWLSAYACVTLYATDPSRFRSFTHHAKPVLWILVSKPTILFASATVNHGKE